MRQNDPGFWAALWRRAREEPPVARRRCRNEAESIAHWSRRASRFARQTGGTRGGGGYAEALRFLEYEGALKPGISVLDIGAGTGNLTLPMARLGAQVTALEPAEKMREILERRAVAEGVTGVDILAAAWQDVDLIRDGMERGFDLVVASMTPGIREPEDLHKMLAASRRYCYYSAYSGERWDEAQRDLWRVFFGGEELSGNPGDIIYPFNYLYALGYRPVLRFDFENRVREGLLEDAVDELCQFFWQYMDITEEVRLTIAEYVRERSIGGVFRRENTICRGMMIWRVDRRPGFG
ncbi:MAG: class I SAM-dependent methyltransferase [Thermoanaerobacterales bacterium]|nr:class I SAM-dependent methyltransferase [Thermoanaerobacterales bacterium]